MYVVKFDNERVRFCTSEMQLKAALRHINGTVVKLVETNMPRASKCRGIIDTRSMRSFMFAEGVSIRTRTV